MDLLIAVHWFMPTIVVIVIKQILYVLKCLLDWLIKMFSFVHVICIILPVLWYFPWISVVNDEFVRDPVKFSNQSTTFGQAFSDFYSGSKKGSPCNLCYFLLFNIFYVNSISVVLFCGRWSWKMRVGSCWINYNTNNCAKYIPCHWFLAHLYFLVGTCYHNLIPLLIKVEIYLLYINCHWYF